MSKISRVSLCHCWGSENDTYKWIKFFRSQGRGEDMLISIGRKCKRKSGHPQPMSNPPRARKLRELTTLHRWPFSRGCNYVQVFPRGRYTGSVAHGSSPLLMDRQRHEAATVRERIPGRNTHVETTLDRDELSTGKTQSACSVSSLRASTELYGLVITSSSTDGKTTEEKRYTWGKWSSNRVRR